MATTTDVLMPLMGEGITEVTLVKWLKAPGAAVQAGEPLLEVSTDKVDTEIPAPTSGFLLQILAEPATVVAVNTVIAVIASEAGAVVGAGPRAPAPTVTAEKVAAPIAAQSPLVSATGYRSSPLVRKMAREHQIDLRLVPGSGLSGRITKRDVEAWLQSSSRGASALGREHATSARLKTQIVAGVESMDGVPVRREKMSRMRTLIAEHMVESVRVSPHVTTVFEIDLHKVVSIREQHKLSFQQREGFNLTYTPFLLHAATAALKSFPLLNSSIDGDEILFKNDINLGCAVALENGLIVPVIKKAGELSLLGIARGLNDLVSRARTKKLTPDEVQGGTFSVTNPGGFGSLTSNPIINQPQVAILGIGAVVKRAVVLPGDLIGIRPMILISLTFDHRVVDGEQGAKYLAKLRDILESYDTQPL